MTIPAIVGLVYGGGALSTLGLIFAANAYARTVGTDEPFAWGTFFLDDGSIANAFRIALWPLTLTALTFTALGNSIAQRDKRRALAAEEKRKWLEAEIP